jgi:hypothetical protein
MNRGEKKTKNLYMNLQKRNWIIRFWPEREKHKIKTKQNKIRYGRRRLMASEVLHNPDNFKVEKEIVSWKRCET